MTQTNNTLLEGFADTLCSAIGTATRGTWNLGRTSAASR
jgi:hypothetical protein